MVLFPQFFRLSRDSRRAYQLWVEGDSGVGPTGPQGPPGPAGAQGDPGPSPPDLAAARVYQNYRYPEYGNFYVYRTVIQIPAGPNNNQIAVPILPSGFLNFHTPLKVGGCLFESLGFQIIPLPHVGGNVHAPAGIVSPVTVWLDDTNVYLSSVGDYSAWFGFVFFDTVDNTGP